MSAGSNVHGSVPAGRTMAATHAALRPPHGREVAGPEPTVARSWDRREFMGTVAASALGALVPIVATSLTPARVCAAATTKSGSELLADWTIDDMFGVWPRYADPIPHACTPTEDVPTAEPLDAI